MKISPRTFCLISSGLLSLSAAIAQQPDNTKENKGDASKSAATADQQKEKTNDRQLTQQIRKSIMADKTLSTYAHNVKIVSQDGKITLKGPVRSEDEKKAIESKAVEVAGSPDRIDDQISIASK
jgi:hyperosmotically inducible protein